jgi:Zn-dependent peptidase ImmA (M78 family)
MKVPWLPKKTIADTAADVIFEYEAKIKRPVQPPIPVEAIIERGLGLKLGFADLRKKLKLEDILGATYVKEHLICVDNALSDGNSEGRLCFTCAHEIGHWMLHRKFVDRAARFESDPGSILCRIKDAKKPIEWQADYFASCLLMPEKTVRDAFHNIYGAGPLILYNLDSSYCGPICFDPCVANWPRIADDVKKAGGFSNVSKQAMIIRLQDLGLIKNETRARMGWEEIYALT